MKNKSLGRFPCPSLSNDLFKTVSQKPTGVVQSLEEMIQARQEKKAEKKARKAELKDKAERRDADTPLWNN